MAYLSSPLSQADRFSPAALAFAVLLHVAVAGGLWWLSPFRPFKPLEDVIEVTVDRGGTPAAEEAAAAPEPTPPPSPQTLAMPRPTPPALPPEPPRPEPPQQPVEQSVPPPEPPPPPPTAMDFPKPAPPPPPKVQPKPPPQPQPQRPAPQRPPAADQATQPAPSPLRNPSDAIIGPRGPTQNEYFTQLHHKLAQHRYYPQSARDRHQEGRVVVRLVIARDGRLLDARVERSSGVPAIDAAEVDTVRRAAPFPPLPLHVAGETATFLIPVTYELR